MKPQYLTQHGMLIDGNFWQAHPHAGEAWSQSSAVEFIDSYEAPDNGPSLDELRAAALSEIKQAAASRISATDWKLQRAEDRLSQANLGDTDQITALDSAEAELLKVLNAREAIRQASNTAETQLLALESTEAVESFSW